MVVTVEDLHLGQHMYLRFPDRVGIKLDYMCLGIRRRLYTRRNLIRYVPLTSLLMNHYDGYTESV